MKKLVLNDSRQIEVQSASKAGGVLHIRVILTTAESLKALFQDGFATQKMTLFENQKTVEVYENFTEFKYIKEESGGIFEVELAQKEADAETRLANAEKKMADVEQVCKMFAQLVELMRESTVLKPIIDKLDEALTEE